MALRPYQNECVSAILSRRAAGVKRQLVSMSTALGKSLIFGALPQYTRKGKRTLMIVHTKQLVWQGAEHLRRWNPGLKVGIEMAGEHTEGEQIVVASVQTIGRSMSERIQKFDPDDFDFVIVDEAHLALSETYRKVFEHFGLMDDTRESPCLVGLTATVNRSDGLPMGQVFQEIVYSYGIREGIDSGWLSDIIGVRVKTQTDISRVAVVAGEFASDDLEIAINTPERNAEIVKAWLEHAWPRRSLIFTASIQHAKDVVKGFQSSGISADAIWGSDPDRDEKIRKHRCGELTVLACAQLLSVGYDDPGIECVCMARPTKSQTFFIQACGRGIRLGPGVSNLVEMRSNGLLTEDHKQEMLLLDFADVTGRHSLITLPSLFGLSPELDLQGHSVMAAVKAIEQAKAQYPNADLSGLKDITTLRSYVEAANLWRVSFAEETQGISKLQWAKRGDGSYRLLLPHNESFIIREDMVNKFRVMGSLKGTKYEQGCGSLAEAVTFTELQIAQQAKEILTLLRKESKWHSGVVSDAQRALLLKFKIPRATIDTMTKGDAAKLITQRFGSKHS